MGDDKDPWGETGPWSGGALGRGWQQLPPSTLRGGHRGEVGLPGDRKPRKFWETVGEVLSHPDGGKPPMMMSGKDQHIENEQECLHSKNHHK